MIDKKALLKATIEVSINIGIVLMYLVLAALVFFVSFALIGPMAGCVSVFAILIAVMFVLALHDSYIEHKRENIRKSK